MKRFKLLIPGTIDLSGNQIWKCEQTTPKSMLENHAMVPCTLVTIKLIVMYWFELGAKMWWHLLYILTLWICQTKKEAHGTSSSLFCWIGHIQIYLGVSSSAEIQTLLLFLFWRFEVAHCTQFTDEKKTGYVIRFEKN